MYVQYGWGLTDAGDWVIIEVFFVSRGRRQHFRETATKVNARKVTIPEMVQLSRYSPDAILYEIADATDEWSLETQNTASMATRISSTVNGDRELVKAIQKQARLKTRKHPRA
jgi:hypothetical protein